ncbi:hypothetical protein ACQ4PT_009458 [Festuca glaucescens]
MASPSAPPPSSSWVILGSIPSVSTPADGGDASLALTAPPRVSILTVTPRVFPDPPTPHFFPSILAADPSGLLLLQANLRCTPTRQVIDQPGQEGVTWKYNNSRYFVLDATTGSAFHLPDPDPPAPGHHPAPGPAWPCQVGEWVAKPVHYPLPPRSWAATCVLSHHGRLWWVDLSWGIITCDPFADELVLGFIPFPPDRVLKCREAWGVTDQYRCVGVSDGKLRFVDTYMGKRRARPTVSVWTLADPDSTEWTLEHEATFTEIWADQSYKATRLPKNIPTLALVHPKNPDVVYFFLEEHLFGVDVRARKVVECEAYGLVAPPSCCIATCFVRAWELPRALSSDVAFSVAISRR